MKITKADNKKKKKSTAKKKTNSTPDGKLKKAEKKNAKKSVVAKTKSVAKKKVKKLIAVKQKRVVRKKTKKSPKVKTKGLVKAPLIEEKITHGEDLHLIPVEGEIHPIGTDESHRLENIFQNREEVTLQQENRKVKDALGSRKNLKRNFRITRHR